MQSGAVRRTVTCVGVAFAALMLAYALALPPYEGFDENAHYSYIAFLSDRWDVPDFRTSALDRAVDEQADRLPRRYSATPRYEANGGVTYGDFFRRTPESRRRAILAEYWRPPETPARYAPQQPAIWIAQHPPLYYAVMAVPYRTMRSLSQGHRLVALRCCSALLACGSLVFWMLAVRLFSPGPARMALLLGGVAILFFPSCWFDLGRLGNDSLVALLSSALFYFLLRVYRNDGRHAADFWAIAGILGAGLLTKLFFLPLYAGSVAWIGWFAFSRRRRWVWQLLCVGILPVVIASPWFWLCWQRYGSPLTTLETFLWSQPNPVAVPNNDSFWLFVWGMVRSVLVFTKSFVWSSSWSYVGQPLFHYVLASALLLLAGWNILRKRWKSVDVDLQQLTLVASLLLAPLLLNCVYYMYLKGRFDGFRSTIGGYYLFTVWTLLAVFLGHAFDGVPSRWGRRLAMVAVVSVLWAELYGVWLMAQVYAGVVEKLGDAREPVGFCWPTPSNLTLVHSRLACLAFPGAALFCYAIGWVARLLLLGQVFANRSPTEQSEEQATKTTVPCPETRRCGLRRDTALRP